MRVILGGRTREGVGGGTMTGVSNQHEEREREETETVAGCQQVLLQENEMKETHCRG